MYVNKQKERGIYELTNPYETNDLTKTLASDSSQTKVVLHKKPLKKRMKREEEVILKLGQVVM